MKFIAYVLWLIALAMWGGIATGHAQYLVPLYAPPSPVKAQVSNPEFVKLYGEIDEKMAADVIEQIQAANREKSAKPIFLFINSPGGSILDGGRIIDAMLASRRPVVTVCVSFCASMGAMTFEYGAKRVMFRHAVLMFHEASMGSQGDLSHVSAQVALVNRIVAGYEVDIAKRAGLTVDEYRAHEAAQWWLLTDEAVAARMADLSGATSDYPAR